MFQHSANRECGMMVEKVTFILNSGEKLYNIQSSNITQRQNHLCCGALQLLLYFTFAESHM